MAAHDPLSSSSWSLTGRASLSGLLLSDLNPQVITIFSPTVATTVHKITCRWARIGVWIALAHPLVQSISTDKKTAFGTLFLSSVHPRDRD